MWINGVAGRIRIQDQNHAFEMSTIAEVADYVRTQHTQLSPDVLSFLAMYAFFLALRDYVEPTDSQLIAAAEKAIDSFYFVTADAVANRALDRGIEDVKLALRGMIGSSPHHLVEAAYEVCTKRIVALFTP